MFVCNIMQSPIVTPLAIYRRTTLTVLRYVHMCHMRRSDYNPFPRDWGERSFINNRE